MPRARSRRRARKSNFLHVRASGRSGASGRIRIVFRILVVAGAVALVGWSAGWAVTRSRRVLFTENGQFTLRHIEATTDGSLPPSLLREFSGAGLGQNLFALRLPEIRSNLLAVPQVHAVQVERRLPDRLVLDIKERIPIARVGDPRVGRSLLVDREGRLMRDQPRMAHLPVIHGLALESPEPGGSLADPRASDALVLIEHAGTTHLRQRLPVLSVDALHPAYLIVELTTGERARIGRTNLPMRLVNFAAAIQSGMEQGERIRFIDLTVDNNFPVIRQ